MSCVCALLCWVCLALLGPNLGFCVLHGPNLGGLCLLIWCTVLRFLCLLCVFYIVFLCEGVCSIFGVCVLMFARWGSIP